MTSSNNCVIETSDGPIRGFVVRNEADTYYKFSKIPYAKPPLGPLRFRPPCPSSPWTEELDCTQEATTCFESSFYKEQYVLGPEDCLYVNVSTKNLTPDKPLPVMFWIGSFVYASSIDHVLDPCWLIDHDVVFVRCGFRLGPFGFLSINEFIAPGNCGLKDMVMALKWVQKNIHKFGGDPNNVTIFGTGTGGSAVHLLMLSSMASGLFHKAIIQSASALNNWSITKNPSQPVMQLATRLGIITTNLIEVVEELRSIPAEDIVKTFTELYIDTDEVTDFFDSPFKPCIEQEFEGLSAFLTKSPMAILRSGNFNKVPLMIGSNNVDGSIVQHVKSDFYDDFEKYNKNVRLLVPKTLSHHDTTASRNIGEQLTKFYMGDEGKLTENTRAQYIQMISDYYFIYFVNKTVRVHREFAPECAIYYYIFNWDGELPMPKDLAFLNSHSTELLFMFRVKAEPELYGTTRESIATRRRVTKMWTNFAKYSNPTPDEDDPILRIKWDPVESKEKLNYIRIGTELTKGKNPFEERMQFWERLHEEYSLLRMLVYLNDLGVSR